jgi:hypothetical protein
MAERLVRRRHAVLVEERFPSVLVVDRTFVMHAKTDVRDCRERSCVEGGRTPETQRRGAERRPQPELARDVETRKCSPRRLKKEGCFIRDTFLATAPETSEKIIKKLI